MQLQLEVEEILDRFFPAGLPPSRVKEAAERGDATLINPESESQAP